MTGGMQSTNKNEEERNRGEDDGKRARRRGDRMISGGIDRKQE